MSERRCDPPRGQFWRETLAAWEKSEQSVRAYLLARPRAMATV
jgi:hypothetical protein